MLESFLSIFANPQDMVALGSLLVMEIVLGIDNVVFMALCIDKLPARQRRLGHMVGMSVAVAMRLVLLMFASSLKALSDPFATIAGHPFSVQSVLFLVGGLFLIMASTNEIFDHEEHKVLAGSKKSTVIAASFGMVMAEVAWINAVFSVDSILTAIGMTDHLMVIAIAIIGSSVVMLVSAGVLSKLIAEHRAVKMSALLLLSIIGFKLFSEGLGVHVPHAFVYVVCVVILGVLVYRFAKDALAAKAKSAA